MTLTVTKMSTKIKVLRPYFWSAERIETKAVGHLSYTVCLIIHYGVPLELSILAIACFRTSWVNWYHIGNGCHYQQSANYLFFHLLGTISPFCVTTLLTTILSVLSLSVYWFRTFHYKNPYVFSTQSFSSFH